MSKGILIIDDEQNIRRVLRLTLEAAGYEVGEAGDSARGLAEFGDGAAWDVVLLDQKMPDADGIETLRRIKERASDARVVMMTAFASVELAVEAMKLGASDFVRKPMTPETVRNALAAALAKSATSASGSTQSPAPPRADSDEPLIQTITMNGFQITRPPEMAREIGERPDTRRFVVQSPKGEGCEVFVNIPTEVVAHVARLTHRRLAPSSSFWTNRAERTLANYLWLEGRAPDETLSVEELSRDELEIAARWEGD